jgi:hypothetical protein
VLRPLLHMYVMTFRAKERGCKDAGNGFWCCRCCRISCCRNVLHAAQGAESPRVGPGGMVDLMLACRTWTQGGSQTKTGHAGHGLPVLLLAPSHEAEK